MGRTVALAGFGPLLGCFEEAPPVPNDESTTVVMCVQAPCTATEPGPDTGPGSSTGAGPGETTSAGPGSDTSASGESEVTGPVATCGDGELNQDSEMCDGTPVCLPDCTFKDYDCNPLNDAACVEGLRCGAVDVPLETFSCMPPGAGGVGDPCTGVPTNDGDCQAGLTCLFNINTPLCDSGNCCVEYCDVTDPAAQCSGGAVCRQFFIDSMFEGLEHLGFCGEP